MISRHSLTLQRIFLAAVVLLSYDNKSVGQEHSDYLLRKPAQPKVFRTLDIPVDLEQEKKFQNAVKGMGSGLALQ
jgi:hypothetical protein